MPDAPKRKLSGEPIAANLLPRDRLVLLRSPLDEADASRRNRTVSLAAVRAALDLPVLYVLLDLTTAQGLSGNEVKANILYAITGDDTTRWNAVAGQAGSGTKDTIVVLGCENYFDLVGVRLNADGVPVERVSVNVGLGTYVAQQAGGGTYTDAQARAAQLNRVAPAGTMTVALTAEAPDDYGTALSGTFTVDPTGCVVGKVVRFALGTGTTAPVFGAAPGSQPYKYYGISYTNGRALSYSLLVCVDRIEVVILAD